jgi:hypothetical protein
MSKERARRRVEREAARAVAEAKRRRRELREARWRALRRRFRPQTGRSAWGLGRRSPAQRSILVGVALAALGAVWYFVDSWPGRIAFGLLILLAMPVFAVLTFDRKGMKL